jgi:hypothetical protein
MPQIQIGKQPVTQITIIEAEPEKQAEALAIMTERARLMARQPGFISNQPASQSRWAPHRELHSMGNPRPAAGRTSRQNFAKAGVSSKGSPTISIPICTRSPKYSTISSETSADEREAQSRAGPYLRAT